MNLVLPRCWTGALMSVGHPRSWNVLYPWGTGTNGPGGESAPLPPCALQPRMESLLLILAIWPLSSSLSFPAWAMVGGGEGGGGTRDATGRGAPGC